MTRRTGVRLAAVLAALLLGLLSLRSMGVDYLERRSPTTLERLFPESAPAVIARNPMEDLLRGPVGELPGKVSDLRGALAEEPMGAEPLVLLGMARARIGDLAGTDAMVRRALSIDPRSPSAHLWLLYRSIDKGNHAFAANEAIRLMELLPERGQALAGVLVQQAADPAARRAIRDSAMSPASRAMVMEAALASRLPTSALAEMVPDALIAPGVAQGLGIRQLRIRMEQDNDFAGLLRLWRRTLPQPAPPFGEGIYDGSFQGLPGGAPFNWSFTSGANGSAERSDLSGAPAPTGLVVSQSGFSGGDYAEQLVLLQPGAHRLTLSALSEASEGSHTQPIHIVLLCATTGASIADLAIAPGAAWQKVAYRFTVPAENCPAQRLRIGARPQSESDTARLTLTQMAIVRDGQ